MKAGKLRHYLDIEQVSYTTGDRGQDTPTWSAIFRDYPAEIEALSGKKLEIARQIVSSATHAVTLRFIPIDMKSNRFNWSGKVYEIGALMNTDERNIELKAIVTEVIA